MKKIYFLSLALFFGFSSKIYAQCSTPSIVPYYQGFQGTTVNGQLPLCWTVSNPSTCTTYTGSVGNGYAAFISVPAGNNYFYTNAFQLEAGVTYSASIWYIAGGSSSSSSWTNLSLLVGSGQNTTGQTTIASTSNVYGNNPVALSNTFVVATSGVYYFSVAATSNGSNGLQFMTWDDLTITIPCTIGSNSPQLNIISSTSVICGGSQAPPVTFTASGADTYTWSNGANTATASITPQVNTMIYVTGTKTLSGCTATVTSSVAVYPSPNLIIYANSPLCCVGGTVNLTVFGANSYTWTLGGQQTSQITLTPTATTVYTVVGVNSYGCVSTMTQNIIVNPLPTITVSSAVTSNSICNGNSDTLTASGALSYSWSAQTGMLSGAQVIVSPNITTTYVVTGTDNNNCSSSTSFVLQVNGCTGLPHLSSAQTEIIALPNPFHDEFLLNTGTGESKEIEITDLSGRNIMSITSMEDKIRVNTRYFSNGIYYVHVKSSERNTVLKLIKTD